MSPTNQINPSALPNADDADDADDAASKASVSRGSGMLAGMMSWIRRAMGTADGEPTVASLESEDGDRATPPLVNLLEPLKSRDSEGNFNCVTLMQSLDEYSKRYKNRLHGDGLVLGFSGEMPPPAFLATAKQPGYQGVKDTFSFLNTDYSGNQAAERAIIKLTESYPKSLASVAPRQLAWLVNAACVRAAHRMAEYANGSPEFDLGNPSLPVNRRAPRLVFSNNSHIGLDVLCNATGLRQGIKQTLRVLFEERVRDECDRVKKEFMLAVSKACNTSPNDVFHLGDQFQQSTAITSLIFSYLSFVNLRGVIESEKRFIASLDRVALSDAMRHSSNGMTLRAYMTHSDTVVKEDLARHAHHGALAFAHYSDESIKKLSTAHSCGDDVVWPGGQSLQKKGSPEATLLFKEMNANLSEAAKGILRTLSPRYTGVIAIGDGRFEAVGAIVAFTASPADAERAGRRLALALNELIVKKESVSALPWAKVFRAPVLMKMLISDVSDEVAVRGLFNFFETANAMRSRGIHHSELWAETGPRLWTKIGLQKAEAFMDAPPGNSVAAIFQLIGRFAPAHNRMHRSARKAQDNLMAELLKDVPLIRTNVRSISSGSLGIESTLAWRILMAGPASTPPFRSAQGEPPRIRIALCGEGAVLGAGSIRPWIRQDIDVKFVDEQAGFTLAPTDKNFVTYFNRPFSPLVDQKKTRAGYESVDLVDVSGCGISHSAIHNPKHGKPTRAERQSETHAEAVKVQLAPHMARLVEAKPLEWACLFPEAANQLHARIKTNLPIPLTIPNTLTKAKAYKLALVCLSTSNESGFDLVINLAKNPLAKTATGSSLLDIALESREVDFARSALQSFANHPLLAAQPKLLTNLIQGSLGKLTEMHPSLLPLAMSCGVVVTPDAQMAWDALHPQRKTPEAEAALRAGLMSAVIEKAKQSHQIANPPMAESADSPDSVAAPVDLESGAPAPTEEPSRRRRMRV